MKYFYALLIIVLIALSNESLAAERLCELVSQETMRDSKLLEERIVTCKKLANEGDVDAQQELIAIYTHSFYGWGDIEKAEKWARLSAQSKTAKGYDNIGWVLSLKPNITKKEEMEAVHAYVKANQMGLDNAMRLTELLEKYMLFSEAPDVLAWLKQEANNGNATFQYFLGKIYLEGLGVPQDAQESVAWYMKLLQQKTSYTHYAPYMLGSIYEKGKGGVLIDEQKATEFYKIGAERGDHNSKVKIHALLKDREGLPILPVMKARGGIPVHWVAELYSDGTIDILTSYQGGKWAEVDFNGWVESHFEKEKLPKLSLGPEIPTMVDMVQLRFEDEPQNTVWFPSKWHSMVTSKEYQIDRMAMLGSECDPWYSLVVKGKKPHEVAIYNDEDEQYPHVVDTITSWNVKDLPIKNVKLQDVASINALVLEDFEKEEEKLFEGLKQRMQQYNPKFLQDKRFSSQHIWQKEDRKEHRQLYRETVRKMKLLDGSALFQVTLNFAYQDSFFQTYYNAWVSSKNGKETLLDTSSTLADIDWKSIAYELPLAGAFVEGGNTYGFGGYYSAGTNKIIYKLSLSGAKSVFEKYGDRSCE